MAIPARPLPAFLADAAAAPAPPAAPATPAVPAAPAAPGRFRINKGRGFTAADLEAGYARQKAKPPKWPSWLDRMLNPPNPAQPGAGLLPTLPPAQFPLMTQLISQPPV